MEVLCACDLYRNVQLTCSFKFLYKKYRNKVGIDKFRHNRYPINIII